MLAPDDQETPPRPTAYNEQPAPPGAVSKRVPYKFTRVGVRSRSVTFRPLPFRGEAMRLRTSALLIVVAALTALVVVPGAAAAPRAASPKEILIGTISTETNAPVPISGQDYGRQTLTAWLKTVNAAGGINGAKVKLKVIDDKNDPAAASKGVKDLIDAGAVAIVGYTATATYPVWAPVAAEAGVPVIGGGCYNISGNADENYFCVTTTAVGDGLKAQVQFAADQGAKSFGITYASDIPAAAGAAPLFKAFATGAGLQFTDAVGTTNTQPDYTAACVTFKQANTTDVGIEGAPLLPNLARDCARQDFNPTWTSGDGQISQNSWLKDPNIKKAIAAVYSFPFMLTKGTTPEQTKSLKTFHTAMNKYAPSILKSDNKQPSTTTWTAAKAFEAAASTIPAGTPATAALIKQGLYTFKDETLGGLAPNPITFTEGEANHPHNSCWFGMVLKNGKLTAPKGMETTCTPVGN
jgi:branched-chain amino acid transport system substrate-binding protein